MARIRSLVRVAGTGRVHPTVTDATWCVVSTPEGPLVQLSTYGSDDREREPKVSQTLQFDKAIGEEFARALLAQFNSGS